MECCEPKEERKDLALLILSIVLTLPLLIQMFFPFLPGFLQLIFSGIVQFVCGWKFYRGSHHALKHGHGAGMDLLVAIGTSVAFFYSAAVYIFRLNLPLYFETSATIITLVLLGRYFEMLSQKKARSAVEALYKLQPKTALVKRDGAWKEIPVDEIQIGDVFQVRPGERVPIDGVVVEGKSEIDESMLTGESLPVYKESGKEIFMATQNGTGALVAKATTASANTAFAHIVRLMKEAEGLKAPIQKTVDKVSALFIPLVLVFSLFTFVVWWLGFHSAKDGLLNSIATLVIACPCALGMATPLVILLGVRKGARQGILIRNIEALQMAEKLKNLAFDKTGTITEGTFGLVQVIPEKNLSRDELLRLAGSLEAYSEHPIAKVITREGKNKVDVKEFSVHPGLGVSGKIEGKNYSLGSSRFMETLGLKVEKSFEGKNTLTLSSENEILGHFVLEDKIRTSAKEVVAELKRMGIKSVMVTGDKRTTAEKQAAMVGIVDVRAEILPEDKVKAILELKSEGKVGMVGDGINDAPALAASDCGFSMGSGVDIAMRASDVTLVKNDLWGIPKAIRLSKITFKKIRQNLFFAFIYNIAAIPIAAMGFLNPMIAGLAMAASSLTVVLNSLLLNREKI